MGNVPTRLSTVECDAVFDVVLLHTDRTVVEPLMDVLLTNSEFLCRLSDAQCFHALCVAISCNWIKSVETMLATDCVIRKIVAHDTDGDGAFHLAYQCQFAGEDMARRVHAVPALYSILWHFIQWI